jgi:hypothetical protein
MTSKTISETSASIFSSHRHILSFSDDEQSLAPTTGKPPLTIANPKK